MGLYRVTLNWSGEVHVFWTWARSERRALSFACMQLATILEVGWMKVLMKYKHGDYNYEIRKFEHRSYEED